MNGDKVGGDVMAVFDKNLFMLPGGVPVTLTANLGGLFVSQPNVFRLDRQTEPVFAQLRRKGFPDVTLHSDVIEYGMGLKLPLWVNDVGGLVSTASIEATPGRSRRSILTRRSSRVRYALVNGFAAQVGADFGLSNSVNRYNMLAGITWTGPQPPCGCSRSRQRKDRLPGSRDQVERSRSRTSLRVRQGEAHRRRPRPLLPDLAEAEGR